MAKIERYRGMEKSQLDALSMDETLALLTSRARRAVARAMKGQNINLQAFMKRVAAKKAKNPGKVIRTHIRDAVILPQWMGLTFAVHAGKEWRTVVISPDKIGYRLGDFAHSTGRVLHSGPGIGATRGSKFIPLK